MRTLSSPREKGLVYFPVLVAVIALIGFILISSSADFKDKLFATLYPGKKSAEATVQAISFTDLDGNTLPVASNGIPQTMSSTVKIHFDSPFGKPLAPVVKIRAWGSPGISNPIIRLQDGSIELARFPVRARSKENAEILTYTFPDNTTFTAIPIIKFINGAGNISEIDSKPKVSIDYIDIDGVIYETESPKVYSSDLCGVKGNLEKENLDCAGDFRYNAYKPTITTVAYKFAESAFELEEKEFVPYTSHPLLIEYEFVDKSASSKSIWVDFKDSTGTVDRRSAQIELRPTYWVKPYLVYPADKPMFPEWETAVKNFMVELQAWYKEKAGVTFSIQPLVVIRSSYNYDTMRCDPDPFDDIPSSPTCLSDPYRLEGNWGVYMNLAIHNGVQAWEEQTAALVFGAGAGGIAVGDQYSNNTGYALVGDYVLEPISGVENSWGMKCSSVRSGSWCWYGYPKGRPAHELGHAFGLKHPDRSIYPDPSIMNDAINYPTVGFLQYEIDYLKQSPFFK